MFYEAFKLHIIKFTFLYPETIYFELENTFDELVG